LFRRNDFVLEFPDTKVQAIRATGKHVADIENQLCAAAFRGVAAEIINSLSSLHSDLLREAMHNAVQRRTTPDIARTQSQRQQRSFAELNFCHIVQETQRRE